MTRNLQGVVIVFLVLTIISVQARKSPLHSSSVFIQNLHDEKKITSKERYKEGVSLVAGAVTGLIIIYHVI